MCEKYEHVREIFEEMKTHRFRWSDRYAPEEYIKAKMLIYVHYVDMIRDIYPDWSLSDCCNILDISEHEYELFKTLTGCVDCQYDNYITATREAMKEGYFTPVVIKYNIPEEPLRHIIEQHHRSALDMYSRIGLPVGWTEEQRHRAEMICNYWDKVNKEKAGPVKEKPKTKRKELGEKQWRRARDAFVNAYVCNVFPLEEVLDIFALEGSDRADMYRYAIDRLRDIVENYEEEGSDEERWLYLDEMDINENDIKRFRDEIDKYDNIINKSEPVYKLTGTNGLEETGDLIVLSEEIEHALQLVMVVENVAEILKINTEKACLACDCQPFAYDFAKMLEQLSGGFRLKISGEELDKLNENAYRAACEIAEEYKAGELERVKCMSRKNERAQKIKTEQLD